MQTNQKRRMVFGACFAVGVFTAASLGYIAGSTSSSEPGGPDRTAIGALAVTAVSADGETSTLTGEDAQTYEENIAPINESEVTFDENVDLSSGEVDERKEALSEDYEVGEPLSLEDLEFMRAYLIESTPSSGEGAPDVEAAVYKPSGSTAVIDSAAYKPSDISIAPVALFNLNQSFNVTKTGAGATANASGSITGGINAVDANWGVSWTTKRTAGVALTKITSTVTADAYGAVAAWPFVGKIYSQTRSATSPAGASSWTFSRGGYVPGVIAYMQIDCKSFVYTAAGSFQLP